MHRLFGDVLWIVLGVGVLASIWAMAGASKEWQHYAERGLDMDRVRDAARQPVSATVAAAERDSEIRQMVDAANARRMRRGEPPRDVEAEIARLTRTDADARATAESSPWGDHRGADPDLEAEVRALVQLRNQRRVRRGETPLDVEAEVARQLDELRLLGH